MLRAGQGRGRRGMGGEPWYLAPQYAGMPGIADFNLERFALPSLGPELVANGTFDADLNGWTILKIGTSSATWVNGKAVLSRTDANNRVTRFERVINTIPGQVYQLNGDFSGASFCWDVGTASSLSDIVQSNTQSTVYFVAKSATTYVSVRPFSDATLTVDTISSKEVRPSQLRAATREEWEANFKASVSDPATRLKMDQTGVYTGTPADKFRIDWSTGVGQLVIDPQSTNVVTNASFTGVVDGTNASLPNFNNVLAGLTRDAKITLIKGVRYLDLRFYGTPTQNSGYLDTSPYTAMSVVQGDKATATVRFQLLQNHANLTSIRQTIYGMVSTQAGGGQTEVNSQPMNLDGVMRREAYTYTFTKADVATSFFRITWGMVTGAPIDFAFRIALPQHEKLDHATSEISTATGPVTRAVETFNLPPILQALMDKGGYSVVDETGANVGEANGAATMIKRDRRYNLVALKAAA